MPALNKILKEVDESWRDILEDSIKCLNDDYLRFLLENKGFFPDINNFLNAFKTLPLEKTKYILFGQDPYPRYKSATGYAFMDGMVDKIFSQDGLSTQVNKATSLRNFIKMLLICENKLTKCDTSQKAISQIKKDKLCLDMQCIKKNLEKNGALLLNISLVFTSKEKSNFHLKQWINFTDRLLERISDRKIKLILFGKVAQKVEKFNNSICFEKFVSPHPYNIGFITNDEVINLFKPMKLICI